MTSGTAVFYYDGDCGMCLRLVRRLERMDSHRRITWTPYQSLDEPPTGITWEEMDQAAYLVSDAGEVREGFYAIRDAPDETANPVLAWGVNAPARRGLDRAASV